MPRAPAAFLSLLMLSIAALVMAPVGGAATLPTKIRVGDRFAPSEYKIAVVGSDRNLRGHRFTVVDWDERTVFRGRMERAPGRSAPWRHAYTADFSRMKRPGLYYVKVGKLSSPPWSITSGGAADSAIEMMLGFFHVNRDGYELTGGHADSHLNDAVIHPDSPTHAGEAIDMTGGWMDAGDMIHFTQTTAFATAMLEASARLDPARAGALTEEADVGVRWLVKAHPAPGLFIAQVGDERDHDEGFRDPADDDASPLPGIGTRFAYPEIGGDLGGKAAAALALAYIRTGDPALLTAAREWYAAGLAAGRPARPLKRAGYPDYAANFYAAPNWKDSMASGAAELFRATCEAGDCEPTYEDDFRDFLSDSKQTGPYAAMGAVDDFASFGEAEVCGAFGADVSDFSDSTRKLACGLLAENGRIASRQARSNAFGMPGYFSWGTTAQNGAAGALAALSTAAPSGAPRDGCRVAEGARDYLLGRNPFNAIFIVHYGRKEGANHPHHWASIWGSGSPVGAVVGGPAPRSEVRGEGFHPEGPFDSAFATYEDRSVDYVTSEPAIDYTAASILLFAAIEGRC